ncbi:hypothetical protein CDAR_449091 [Caerostris darwini]|uniref:Uncharacterized protein n=1 Tax=Caerostris darwini TaxID=1538125 RepID=A0AAV4QPG7_9ARAC|nr:hypothetical protein CDAR_449091 [Caerostris darwini]
MAAFPRSHFIPRFFLTVEAKRNQQKKEVIQVLPTERLRQHVRRPLDKYRFLVAAVGQCGKPDSVTGNCPNSPFVRCFSAGKWLVRATQNHQDYQACPRRESSETHSTSNTCYQIR